MSGQYSAGPSAGPSAQAQPAADAASSSVSPTAVLPHAFAGHDIINVGHGSNGKRLLCSLCDAKTGLMCQCGAYVCNVATGRKCMLQHLAAAQAGTATHKRKRTASREISSDMDEDDEGAE